MTTLNASTPAPVTPTRYGTEAEQRAWLYVTLGLPIPTVRS
jgi:hypothetical protein